MSSYGTFWLIIRTDFRKEHYVARRIQSLGFDAWVPIQQVAVRTHAARKDTKSPALMVKELAILPRRLFALLPEPVDAQVRAIRHLEAIECDAALEPLRIPAMQICRFREAIETENALSMALAQRPSKRSKAKWKSLHDGLVDMIDGAKTQMEAAA